MNMAERPGAVGTECCADVTRGPAKQDHLHARRLGRQRGLQIETLSGVKAVRAGTGLFWPWTTARLPAIDKTGDCASIDDREMSDVFVQDLDR